MKNSCFKILLIFSLAVCFLNCSDDNSSSSSGVSDLVSSSSVESLNQYPVISPSGYFVYADGSVKDASGELVGTFTEGTIVDLAGNIVESDIVKENLPYFTGEKALADKIANTENIKILFNKLVVSLNGDKSLESIILKDQTTGSLEQFNIESVFVAIGQEPNNSMFKNLCSLDEQGFIVTNEMCCANIEGVFVAGDCRQKRIRQIVTASSDGSIAALQAIKYLDSKGQ